MCSGAARYQTVNSRLIPHPAWTPDGVFLQHRFESVFVTLTGADPPALLTRKMSIVVFVPTFRASLKPISVPSGDQVGRTRSASTVATGQDRPLAQ